jgi:hypothetical protein
MRAVITFISLFEHVVVLREIMCFAFLIYAVFKLQKVLGYEHSNYKRKSC